MGRRWTDQDIEDLKRMAQYCSAPKIAELNRTAGGVVSKAYQLRLSLRPADMQTSRLSSRILPELSRQT
jgi:hypothetical protein